MGKRTQKKDEIHSVKFCYSLYITFLHFSSPFHFPLSISSDKFALFFPTASTSSPPSLPPSSLISRHPVKTVTACGTLCLSRYLSSSSSSFFIFPFIRLSFSEWCIWPSCSRLVKAKRGINLWWVNVCKRKRKSKGAC